MGDGYIKVASGKARPHLKCKLCGEFPPIKSNQAVVEERDRFLGYLVDDPVTCPVESCTNHSLPIDTPGAYQKFGRTKAGSLRLKCKVCGRVFSHAVKNSLRQRQPHKNRIILSLLLNKSPLRRICEVAEIAPKTLYQRIEFFHEQSMKFAAHRERRLLDGMEIPRLYLAVDRQDYLLNWAAQNDRRNVALHAVGSADDQTGYVFGMHLDYDELANSSMVEADAKAIADAALPGPYREYARLWVQSDYLDEIRAKTRSARRKPSGRLHDGVVTDIEDAYDKLADREDVEAAPTQNFNTRLPLSGMQTHSEYTLYGHFFFLERLLRGAGKIRFMMDQESGIRAACLAAFKERIVARTCDAFYVSINKGLTVNERRRVMARSRSDFEAAKASFPGMTDREVQLELIKARLAAMKPIGKWSDRWVLHPFPSMSEPEMAICYLTDMGDYPADQLASLYRRASLHAIDRFFMQIRRRVNLLERPIKSASAEGRTWYGYSPYKPETVVRVLEIFRVAYNYCFIGDDKKTPAMRLGLAKAPIDLEDVIYFSEEKRGAKAA